MTGTGVFDPRRHVPIHGVHGAEDVRGAQTARGGAQQGKHSGRLKEDTQIGSHCGEGHPWKSHGQCTRFILYKSNNCNITHIYNIYVVYNLYIYNTLFD